MKKVLFIVIIILCFASPLWAASYYIAQSAAGSEDGSSCANAKAYNWNMDGVVGDDIVWICGSITSQLVFAKSGTSGHPVTLKFCSVGDCGAGNAGKLTGTTPNATGNLQCWGAEYVTIDGNSVGIIEATANGTSLANQQTAGKGIYGYCSNLEIKNLTIQNLYVHDYQTGEPYDDAAPDTYGIYIIDKGNVRVHDNIVTHSGRGIVGLNTTGTALTGLEIYNNTTSHSCWGIGTGTGGAGSYWDGAKVYNNTIEMDVNWMSSPASGCHNNGFYNWSGTTGETFGVTNLQIYNNYIHGPLTDPSGTWTSTAMIGFDGYGTQSGTLIYNNLIVSGAYQRTGTGLNGYISIAHQGETPAKVLNNTIIGYSEKNTPCINDDGAASVYRNNICVQGSFFANSASATSPDSDYNDIYDCAKIGKKQTTEYITIADWRTAISGDANSITTDPSLDANYKPQMTSPAGVKTGGVDLSASFTTDKNGDTRTTWGMGAYKYTTRGSLTVGPGGSAVAGPGGSFLF